MKDKDGLAEKPLAGVGDYVLATKYDDGDPCDHFYVGFVSGYTHHGRYLVADNHGQSQRANGFRRAEKITDAEGRRLIGMMGEIGDVRGRSLWWHLAKIRGEENPDDPCEDDDARLRRLACEVLREMEALRDRRIPGREDVHRWCQMLNKGLDTEA